MFWSDAGKKAGYLAVSPPAIIMCLDRTTTGDGIVSALQVLAAMSESDRPLHELKAGMTKYPQVMINVRMTPGFDLDGCTAVQESVRAAEAELSGTGRVLLRPSGTEPLVRVMVEGEQLELVERVARGLADSVESAIAAPDNPEARSIDLSGSNG